MSLKSNTIENQVLRATQRLAQMRARELLRENRRALRAKSVQRRASIRRRIELGDAVCSAGLEEWETPTVLGLLLDGRDRATQSPTMKLALTKRGEEFRRRTRKTHAQRPENEKRDCALIAEATNASQRSSEESSERGSRAGQISTVTKKLDQRR